MHWFPSVGLVVIALIALASSPFLGLLLAVPLFIAFLVYVGLGPR